MANEWRLQRYESTEAEQDLEEHRRTCTLCRSATRPERACGLGKALHDRSVRVAQENLAATVSEERSPLERMRDLVAPRHWWQTIDLSEVPRERDLADFLEEGNLERLRSTRNLRWGATQVAGISGIDVSKWQGRFPWNEAVQAGIGIGIAKSSEGNGYTDGEWGNNLAALLAPGPIVPGSYHFLRPDLGNRGADEARWYLSRHPRGCFSPTQPWIFTLDAESAGGSAGGCYEFLDTVSAQIGYSCWFYSYSSWISSRGVQAFNRPLWIAWPNPGAPPNLGWPAITQVQWGTRPFSVGAVDANVFLGDVPVLLLLAGSSTAPTPGPGPVAEVKHGNGGGEMGIFSRDVNAEPFEGVYIRDSDRHVLLADWIGGAGFYEGYVGGLADVGRPPGLAAPVKATCAFTTHFGHLRWNVEALCEDGQSWLLVFGDEAGSGLEVVSPWKRSASIPKTYVPPVGSSTGTPAYDDSALQTRVKALEDLVAKIRSDIA
jgi:GH25 family lysozyme M1 (1,4-beta-N-acetylmuramidase)